MGKVEGMNTHGDNTPLGEMVSHCWIKLSAWRGFSRSINAEQKRETNPIWSLNKFHTLKHCELILMGFERVVITQGSPSASRGRCRWSRKSLPKAQEGEPSLWIPSKETGSVNEKKIRKRKEETKNIKTHRRTWKVRWFSLLLLSSEMPFLKTINSLHGR